MIKIVPSGLGLCMQVYQDTMQCMHPFMGKQFDDYITLCLCGIQ